MSFKETNEAINKSTKAFIKSCKANKNIEVAFRNYYKAKTENNELALLQYLDPYILSMKENRKYILFIFGFIANNIKNIQDEMSEESFVKIYAKLTNNSKKDDKNKQKNKINLLLKKSNVNDIIKYLEHNILYEIINFNYVSLILDLVYFNKNTRNFWGTDYYKIVNSIQEDEE